VTPSLRRAAAALLALAAAGAVALAALLVLVARAVPGPGRRTHAARSPDQPPDQPRGRSPDPGPGGVSVADLPEPLEGELGECPECGDPLVVDEVAAATYCEACGEHRESPDGVTVVGPGDLGLPVPGAGADGRHGFCHGSGSECEECGRRLPGFFEGPRECPEAGR